MADDENTQLSSLVQRKPESLIDFLARPDSAQVRESSALTVQSRVGGVFAGAVIVGTGWRSGESEESKFAKGVAQVVMSKEFTQELSHAIAPPHDTETEDAFVARAKAKMAALLKSKLLK